MFVDEVEPEETRIAQPDQDVPRRGDEQKQSDAFHEDKAPHFFQPAVQQEREAENPGGKNDADQSLGHDGERRERIHPEQPTAFSLSAFPTQKRVKGQGKQQRETRIWEDEPGKKKEAQGGRKRQSANQPGAKTEQELADFKRHEDERHYRQRSRQPRRESVRRIEGGVRE